MSIAKIQIAALKQRERDLPNTFTWSGSGNTSYACSASSHSHSKTASVGGFEMEADLTVTVRRALFTGAVPAEQQTIAHRSRTFRIARVVEDATGSFLRLICVSPNRGA